MKPWGCPKCGDRIGLVVDTGTDPDGYRVRIRRCISCQTRWATEEVPIEVDAYWARTDRVRKEATRRRYRRTTSCRYCQTEYPVGAFLLHVRMSRAHEAALVPSQRQKRQKGREKGSKSHRYILAKENAGMHDVRTITERLRDNGSG